MLTKILPNSIAKAIQKLNISKLSEIRIRVGKPIIIHYGGLYFLSNDGITDNLSKSIIAKKETIDFIIASACDDSLYAYNNEIKNGFLTASGGIRIGLAGQCISETNVIKTIKNFSSINIRIPHEVKNCSLKILEFVAEPKVHNTLIMSPPGAGKTTLLRDLAFQLSQKYLKNILIVDERNEIANCVNGVPQYELGILTDIMTNCTKQFGLENGIRSLAPNVVLTDEIANSNDIESIEYALSCGVNVIATTHCENIYSFKKKKNFERLIENCMFDRYIVLSSNNGFGTIEGVYDKNFKCLCM